MLPNALSVGIVDVPERLDWRCCRCVCTTDFQSVAPIEGLEVVVRVNQIPVSRSVESPKLSSSRPPHSIRLRNRLHMRRLGESR